MDEAEWFREVKRQGNETMGVTIQRHVPSGELYCLDYDGANEICGVVGPLDRADAIEVLRDPEAGIVDVLDVEWARAQQWGYPLTLDDLES